MTSLSDVYEGEVGSVASRRQQLVGTVLFLAGAAGLVGAIALATTGIGGRIGLTEYAAREIAGIVAGVGLPAVILGVFSVLPTSRRIAATAVIGASIAGLGVVLFHHLYPYNWTSSAPLLALTAGIVYFGGVVTTFWCLFVALATFKTRNDPGGTARMEVTEEGTIRLVEEARSLPGLGGIGFFGREPDGNVATQTNRDSAGDGATVSDGGNQDGAEVTHSSSGHQSAASNSERDPAAGSGTHTNSARQAGNHGRSDSATDRAGTDRNGNRTRDSDDRSSTPLGPSENALDPKVANAGPEASPSTDGGTATTGHDTITETAVHKGEPDTYCGNCRHFEYVMEDGDIEPYCTFHNEVMDDMEACSAWVNND